MPRVRRIRMPQGDTVDRALHWGVVDLLPNHIAESPLVRWVVAFDSALKTDARKSDDRFRLRKDRERWMGALVSQMGSRLLQSRIPFYFASVFHIGRMVVASAESLDRIGALKQPSNLDNSVGNITAKFANQKDLPPGVASSESIRLTLLQACDRGVIRQREQTELADRWWKRWELEVGGLRDAVNEFEEGWRDCSKSDEYWRMASVVFQLWHSTTSSILQSEMTRSGVQFKNLEAATTGTGWNIVESNPMLLMAAFALLGGRDRHPEPWFHFERLVERWLDVERSKAEADQRRVDHAKSEIALQILQQKYIGTNPFDQFAVGSNAATSQLRDLVKEHSLPNGTASPWRQMWQEQLMIIQSYNRPLVGTGGDDGNLRQWCFRTADSAIKGGIDDYWADQLPWKAFVQRLFERKWLVEVAKMARNANTGAKSKTWTSASVGELVSHAVEDLNGIGYEIDVPDSTRIDSLFEKLEKGESVYESTDW